MAAADDEMERYRRTLEGVLGVPCTDGNQIDVLRNGDEIFPAMLDAIRSARSTVDFLTFIYWECSIGDEFAEALAERAAAGLRVRVLLDALGAYSVNSELIEKVAKAGAQIEWFRPVAKLRFWESNHRTHRKVLICDEEVAFTGGVGIADEWRGDARGPHEWRDTHFRIQGPAVSGLRAAFVHNWAETGRPLFEEGVDRFPVQPQPGTSAVQVVRGEVEVGWSDLATLVRALLTLARQRLRVTSAYFVPDDVTCELLRDAARRGVDIDILVPGAHADKRFVQLAGEAQYEALLEAGVRVWEYQPTMLHAKVMTIDGVVANIGSANFNSRSLMLDEEVNLVVLDPAVVEVLDRHFDDDLKQSKPIDRERWERRPLTQRAKEAVSGLVDRNM